MSVHLSRQFDKLKKQILHLGALVEDAVARAITSVLDRDATLAERIIQEDSRIDAIEIDVEEECLHTLACYQPVAQDLRFVVSVLKINNDLERIADLAVNIAEQGRFLAEEPQLQSLPFDLGENARKVRSMLKTSLDALVNTHTELAEAVLVTDDEVDAFHRAMYTHLENEVRADTDRIPQMIHYLSISRQLERIADHAVNIAEDVLYMAKGDIIRHGNNSHQSREPA